MTDKIIFNISSFNRPKTLIKTINSIYHQCDVINVVLNNYDEIPVELYDNKINIFIGDNEKGDAYKFYQLSKSEGYYFTIDDDLDYSENYTEYLIEKIEQYRRTKIVTLHGRNFDSFPIKSYYNDKKMLSHFSKPEKKDTKVQFGGTGVMAFHTDLMKITIDYFRLPNMADVWIGKFANENGIDIVSVSRDIPLVKQQNTNESIYGVSSKNDYLQTQIINQSFTTPEISFIVPTYNNVEYIDQCIDSIISSCDNVRYEILVGIDACEKTLNHIMNKEYNQFVKFYYFNENIGPYIIKNTLAKLSRTDNILFFFDSDDVAKENMVYETIKDMVYFECVKPMFHNFQGVLDVNLSKYKRSSGLWGEGVFAIKKDIFLHYNGFEPWKCAADTDFMVRLYKNNIKVKQSSIPMFYRRIHSEGLTSHPSTGHGSEIRRYYSNITKNKTDFSPLPKLHINDYVELFPKLNILNDDTPEDLNTINKILSVLPQNFNPSKEINYKIINKRINQEVTTPKKQQVVIQNKPKDRNELIKLKKDSLVKLNLEFGNVRNKKKNRNSGIF